MYSRVDVFRVQEDFSCNVANKKKICYARLSSDHQKKDLERQVEILDKLHPVTAIIKYIGSGLNFKRKSLSVLNRVYSREVKEIIVLYNDRL
jgi:predicted site-specific integrase-resolvase